MGRLAPWVEYQQEWEQIRTERHKRGGIAERKTHDTSVCLIPVSSPESEQRNKWLSNWMPEILSNSLGLSRAKSYSDQSQCLLFRLPIELRFAIWDYVLGGNQIRIVRKVNKIAHGVFPRDKERHRRAELVEIGWGGIGHEERFKAHEVLSEINLLTSLQTCKRLYVETM